jgi:hypothetical protein
MAEYEFDDIPSDDDDEDYYGPDAYLEGDDNVLELEIGQEDMSRTAIAQILRSMCLATCLRPNPSHVSSISTAGPSALAAWQHDRKDDWLWYRQQRGGLDHLWRPGTFATDWPLEERPR